MGQKEEGTQMLVIENKRQEQVLLARTGKTPKTEGVL